MRYKYGSHQYTERQMKMRVRKLWLKLYRSKGFDILMTHSPAYQLGDEADLPHTGFKVFTELLERYKPKYFVHGHVHLNYGKIPRMIEYQDTTIINGFEQYIFEYETGNRL
jgi:Icc-related predicted phosphoesterase